MARVRGSITYRMKHEIRSQWDSGRGQSRHQYKIDTGQSADYDRIYSEKSYTKHMSSVNTFGEWLKERHPDVRKIEQIDRQTVAEYLQERDVERSASTVSTDLNAINRVLVGSKNWEQPLTKAEIKREFGYNLRERRLDDITNNRTPAEFMERYRETYKPLIETAESFGLRRTEIIGVDGSRSKGLTEKSFYQSQEDEKLYVIAFGKGGRYRVAECLEERKEEMLSLYAPYVTSVPSLDHIPDRTEAKELVSASEHIYSPNVSNSCVLHRSRAEYAVNLLEQLKEEREAVPMQTISINGHEATEEEFLRVSSNLGHNRMDVLKNYLH